MAVLDDNMKLEILRMADQGTSQSDIADTLGVAPSTVSKFLARTTYTKWWENYEKPVASGSLHDHYHKIKRLPGNRFILTSAQNSTFVHEKFLQSLETMAAHLDATIIVGTFSYNRSGFQNLEKSDGDWFDDRIKPYIMDEPVQLAKDLIWCGELNILPTAVNPLSGFHSYTKSSSGIIPHAKVQLESLPTAKNEPCRMLYTTGAVTQRNYIQKKSGQKASFHHIFGALLVEIDKDGDWFVRQLIGETESGEFYDLDTLYTPHGVVQYQNVEAINWGDIHAEKYDQKVFAASFGKNEHSMIDVLRPKYQFVHDVLDMTSRNHHNINDPYFKFEQYVHGNDWVEADIGMVSNVLKLMKRPFCLTVVVESNHDLALQRWLRTADYRNDPANALFFLDCQLRTYKAIADKEKGFSVFKYALTKHDSDHESVVFLATDESFMICGPNGIECGSHGHLGNNGARGSVQAYQMLGTRFNIGHSHSATIKDGVYQAGVSASLDMGYNKGASSWSHSHIVTYKNSKRTIITIKNGKWRA